MKNFLLRLLLIGLLFTSCGTTQKLSDRKSNITSISFERMPCFGTCPVYTIQIDKNCEATLQVESHVTNKNAGRYHTNLPEKEWLKLSSKLEKMNLEELDSNYGNHQISDLPTANTAIAYKNGGTKEVKDYGARGTEALSAFYLHMDSLVNHLDWELTK